MCRYVSWLYNCMIIIVSFKKCLWKISVLISWLQTIIFIDLLYVQHPQGVSVEHDIECCLLQLETVSNAFLRQEKKKEGEEASQKIHKMLWESWHLEHTPVQIVTLIMTEHVLQRQKTSQRKTRWICLRRGLSLAENQRHSAVWNHATMKVDLGTMDRCDMIRAWVCCWSDRSQGRAISGWCLKWS